MLLAMMPRLPFLALFFFATISMAAAPYGPYAEPASGATISVDVELASPPQPICPITADPAIATRPAALAGNGSGFLLFGSDFTQPLDADGRPTTEARPRHSTVDYLDLDWAGDRYIATFYGNWIAGFSAAGDEILAPVQLPLFHAETAWNGARGLIVGRAMIGETRSLYALPATNDGSLGTPLYLGDSNNGDFAVERFGDGFLAVYVLDQLNLIVALRFDASGAPAGGVQRVAAVVGADDVKAAVHSSGAIVTFRSYLNLVTAVPVRPDGTIGSAGFTMDVVQDYALGATPTGALVYVNRGRGEPSEDFLFTLDSDARAITERRSQRMIGGILVRRDSRGLLLYRNGTTTPLDFEGNPTAPPHPAMLAPADQRRVRISSDGVRFVSAWITKTALGDRIEAATMDATGENRTCFSVHQSSGVVGGIALAASPAGALLAWAEGDAIRGSLLTGGSWTELPIDLPFPEGGDFQGDLAWDGAAFRFVWSDSHALHSTRISPAGSVSPVRTFFAGGAFSAGPIAVLGEATLYTVRTTTASGEMDLPPLVGAGVGSDDPSSGLVQAFSILPDRHWINATSPPVPPLGIASNGSTAIAVVSDGFTLEAVVVAASGMPLRRTQIARGVKIEAAAIAASGNGFVVSWIAEYRKQKWLGYGGFGYLTFMARLDAAGEIAEPARVVPAGWPNTTAAVDLDLAATPTEAIAVWAPRAGGDATSTHLGAYRAVASRMSDGEMHPGPPPPPSSASIREFQSPTEPSFYPKHVELQWTPVAGADAYVIQGTFLEGEGWVHFAVLPGDAFIWDWTPILNYPRLNPARFRIATVKDGLASEWVALSVPRDRVVRRR